MYPHSVTAVLSSNRRSVIRRNASLLPAYSFLLGLLALLGFVAIAAGVDASENSQLAIPLLFEQEFPGWFAGVAFAAIAIGALVPAAIMSIAAANLFTRNIYKAYLKPDATRAQEAQVSKIVSLLVKFGALIFALIPALATTAINLQLLGGIWILQTLPAIVIGLYTRFLHRWALLIGWAVSMAYGSWVAYLQPSPTDPTVTHFGSPIALVGENPFSSDPTAVLPIPVLDEAYGYIALTALVINLVITVVLTLVFRALRAPAGVDHTAAEDYRAEAGEEGVEPLPETV
jgi:SSS family solute:Na+ symporter